MRSESPGIGTLGQSRKTAVGYPLAGTVDEMRLQLRTPGKIFDGVPGNYGGDPVLLEEYGWMWLTRDGKPTRLTRPIYDAMTDWPVATQEERQYARARVLAAETEFFRCHRDGRRAALLRSHRFAPQSVRIRSFRRSRHSRVRTELLALRYVTHSRRSR